ncbi:mannosyltransferase family protein [Propionibacterium freudenreichii]|uniref:mannosyltransferase family protein n=1 Tax=Propionibacterium freudenreichii TaxID=1744 RepID=UPI00054327BA|nr:mannosyltransferase family protein [Propionibacterium freudenreichii]CEG97914.1 Hypothetical membrane protein [Propionibacterium freudenreichii]
MTASTPTPATTAPGAAHPTGGWRRDLRIAGTWWVASRAVYLLAALILGWTGHATPRQTGLPWPVDAYQRFDAGHLMRIASEGYFAFDSGHPAHDEAFFPGFPLLTRTLASLWGGAHPSIAAAVVAGTIVSWLAALAAGVLLVRITREYLTSGEFAGGRVRPHAAAGVFLLGPYSVFLMAPYTEGLFTTCALACWYLAMHRRWNWSLVAATAAGLVRVNGVFLLPMLLVMMLRQGWPHPNRSWWRVLTLAIPLCAPLGYLGYLWARTGDPLYWLHVQAEGWGRGSAPIWDVVVNSVRHIVSAEWFIGYQQVLEFVFLAIFLATLWWCWRLRRYEWLVFVAITLVSLCRGPVLLSLPRNGLDCFPVMLAMAAALSTRRRWLRWATLVLMAATAAINTLTLLADEWTG